MSSKAQFDPSLASVVVAAHTVPCCRPYNSEYSQLSELPSLQRNEVSPPLILPGLNSTLAVACFSALIHHDEPDGITGFALSWAHCVSHHRVNSTLSSTPSKSHH